MADSYWDQFTKPVYYWDNNRKRRRDIIANTDALQRDEQQLQTAVAQIQRLQVQLHDLSVVVMTLVEQLAAGNAIQADALRTAVEEALNAEHLDQVATTTSDINAAENLWDSAGGPVGPK